MAGSIAALLAIIPTTGKAIGSGATQIVSVSSAGVQGNLQSEYPAISADGQFVAFDSYADTLVAGGVGGKDVFIRNLASGTTERVSASGHGGWPSLSADGRFVAYQAGGSVFVLDRPTAVTELVSVSSSGEPGNGNSGAASISGDGRYVAFASEATNLVAGDTNGATDVFVFDRLTRTTERVSVSSSGAQGEPEPGSAPWTAQSTQPAISADGRFIAFVSQAANLVPGDANATFDAFVHDRLTHTTQLVSLSSEGAQANAQTYDRPAISADGRFVAFTSFASNLVAGDTNGWSDVFVRDLVAGTTERVSVSSTGQQANLGSDFEPGMSADGNIIVFRSASGNLTPGDPTMGDVYLHDRYTGETVCVAVTFDGQPATSGSHAPAISADGLRVAFPSAASNIVSGDVNGVEDVFVRTYEPPDSDGDGFTAGADCNDHDASIYPGAPEIKHDGVDQDCNGYDLTIDILLASWSSKNDTLSVQATSALNASAALNAPAYGPLSWNKHNAFWTLTAKPAGGYPPTIAICGVEGCVTGPVIQK